MGLIISQPVKLPDGQPLMKPLVKLAIDGKINLLEASLHLGGASQQKN